MSLGDGIVIGASSGVGHAVTARLAAAGSQVTALSRSGEAPASPDAVVAARADVRRFPELERAIDEAGSRHEVDYVINCAGVGFYAPIGSDHSDAWNDILATNVTGVLNVLSVVDRRLPRLRCFVHVSSMAAHRVSATPGNLCYSVSKSAARTIVAEYRRSLRADGRMTRISMVSPGFVEGTGFGKNFFSRSEEVPDVDVYGDHENLSAEDVADVVCFVVGLPAHIEVLDLVVAATEQPA